MSLWTCPRDWITGLPRGIGISGSTQWCRWWFPAWSVCWICSSWVYWSFFTSTKVVIAVQTTKYFQPFTQLIQWNAASGASAVLISDNRDNAIKQQRQLFGASAFNYCPRIITNYTKVCAVKLPPREWRHRGTLSLGKYGIMKLQPGQLTNCCPGCMWCFLIKG